MDINEIYRRYYHLSFFENNKIISKNEFINCLVQDLYQKFTLYKSLLEKEPSKKETFITDKNKEIDLISIIMPAYNDEDTISYSIESILNQTYSNWELIIIDDGSIDNTRQIVKTFLKDKRIKYFHQNNTGVAEARNKGIKLSIGKYIKLCDSDDILMPYGLEILIRSIHFADENTAIFYDDMVNYFQDLDEYQIVEMNQPLKKPQLYIQQIKGNIFPVGSVLIKKSVFSEIGYFDKELKGTDDFDLWNRIIHKYDVYKINIAPIYIQVHHSEQLSNDIETLRCYTDISVCKLIDNVGLENIIVSKEAEIISRDCNKLISLMILRPDITYEAIFKVIDYAQNFKYEIERVEQSEFLITENNQKFVDTFTDFINEPKKCISEPKQVTDEYNKIFNKGKKLNKIFSKKNETIISDLHEYTEFFIEYKPDKNNLEINSEGYYILYSSCQKLNLPEEIAKLLNQNIDQIWVDNESIKKNYIESGVIENRIKIIKSSKNQSKSNLFDYEKNIINILNQFNLKPVRLVNLEQELLEEINKINENQLQRTLIIYSQLAVIDKKNNIYQNNLAITYIKLKNYKKAYLILAQLIKSNFINKNVLINMATCLENLGDNETALALKKKAGLIK